MQDVKPTLQTHTTPAAHTDRIAGSEPIFKTPIVLLVARGFILFLSLTIMALSGVLMNGLVMDAYAFSLVCALFSIIIVVWELVSEIVPACHVAYNYFALLALDLFMAILWLSSMGANAANRASFVLNATSSPVVIRNIKKRATATPAGLAYMSAIAGLSAIQMLLFIATTAYFGHQTRKHLEAKKAAVAPDNAAFEMKAQSQPMLAEQQQKSQTVPTVPQLTGGTSYASPVDYTYHHQQPPSQVQPYDSSAHIQPQVVSPLQTHQQPAYTHGGHS